MSATPSDGDEPIGRHVGWLEIAVANAFGEKEEWKTRRHWVKEHRELIERVAEDPIGSVELWRDAIGVVRCLARSELHHPLPGAARWHL